MSKWFHIDRTGTKVFKTVENINTSGLVPVENKLILLPDRIVEEQSGIVIPEVAQVQRQLAQVRALLIAVGGNCFEDWDYPTPEPGDRVMVCKYAGILEIRGSDGESYQICVDKDVTALIVEDLPDTDLPAPRVPLGQQDNSRIIT